VITGSGAEDTPAFSGGNVARGNTEIAYNELKK
jgi:hypothetical protein